MRKGWRWLAIGAVLFAGILVAQEAPKPAPERPAEKTVILPYRLDFTVKELEDSKAVNSRNYTLLIEARSEHGRSARGAGSGQVRAGTRVPVAAGDKGMQYMDVGIVINADLDETDDGLSLSGYTELSTLALPDGATSPSSTPMVGSIRSNISTELTTGKSILLSSVDDPVSKRRYQVEVTATKLK